MEGWGRGGGVGGEAAGPEFLVLGWGGDGWGFVRWDSSRRDCRSHPGYFLAWQTGLRAAFAGLRITPGFQDAGADGILLRS